MNIQVQPNQTEDLIRLYAPNCFGRLNLVGRLTRTQGSILDRAAKIQISPRARGSHLHENLRLHRRCDATRLRISVSLHDIARTSSTRATDTRCTYIYYAAGTCVPYTRGRYDDNNGKQKIK
jgi:hypothetical protein